MPTVVTCPECQRKLKVAPASIGKSVKCTCGNVFKAREAADPAGPSTPIPASDTLLVSCASCQTRLKVPASARGRKMKCSKCGTTFVVGDDDVGAAAPPRNLPTPPRFDDDEPPTRPAKKSSRPAPPFLDEDDDEAPAPVKKSARSKPPVVEDDEPEFDAEPPPRPRGKGRPAALDDAPARRAAAAPKSGVGGCLLNVFVLLVVLLYIGALVPIYLGPNYVPLPFERPPAKVPVHRPPLPVQPQVPDGEVHDPAVKKEKPVDEKKANTPVPDEVSRRGREPMPAVQVERSLERNFSTRHIVFALRRV